MTASDVLLLIAAAGAALEAGRRWIYKPLCAIAAGLRRMERVADLAADLEQMLSDWNGRPGRDGFDPVLSFPVRMAVVESNVAEVRHEVTPNSGKSLKDVAIATRTELRLHIADSVRDRQWLVDKGALPPLPIIPFAREENQP